MERIIFHTAYAYKQTMAFHAIPDDFINKIYDSLPNWMATVLQAKGTHTRY